MSGHTLPQSRHTSRPCTTTLMTVILLLLCTLRPTSAQILNCDTSIYESSFYQELAARGEIHVDRREPPPQHKIQLERRQVGDSVVPTTLAATSTSSLSSSTTISSTDSTITSSAESPVSISTETKPDSTSGISTSTAPSITVITTPLPTPFDTSLGSNFTDSACPAFFSSFLGNATFQSCVPISLLLQNSNSFFRAQRSYTLLTQTLNAACNASLAICSPLLTNLASELIDNANCGQDYRQQNPLVVQAYAGLIAYEPVYRATCLRDTSAPSGQGAYCFAEASANSSNSADFYPYYTAIGLNLPAAANPTCSQCLQDTMKVFASYAEDAVQPLSKTYMGCAEQIDKGCGPQYVATDVKVGSVGSSGAGRSTLVSGSLVWLVVSTAVVLWTGWI